MYLKFSTPFSFGSIPPSLSYPLHLSLLHAFLLLEDNTIALH